MNNELNKQPLTVPQPVRNGGLAVRTNLRAGLAWDDLDDQAAALFGKLSSAVSNITSSLTSGTDASKPAA